MDWAIIHYALPILLQGAIATVEICSLSILIGTALGVTLGLASLGRIAVVRWAVLAYVDFMRGTPLLIQIFLVYFALPVIGVQVSEFWAGVIALSLNAGAFIAETVRGTVGAVERGQSEAAMSIGLSRSETLRYILLPQALRPMVPPVTNEIIMLIKGSALLSAISVFELTRAGQSIISVHFVPFEIYLLLALYYYVLISGLAWGSRWLERRLPVW